MENTPAQRRRHLLVGLAIGAACWALLSVAYTLGVFGAFDLKLLDLKFRMRKERQATDAIALVLIDDATIKAYSTWPLPRHQYALLLKALRSGGAAAVGMDLMFPKDSSQDSTWNWMLAEVTRESEKTVHLVAFTSEDSASSSQIDPQYPLLTRLGTPCRDGSIATFQHAEAPYYDLLDATHHVGHPVVAIDGADGGYRRLPLFVRFGDYCYPSLATAVCGVAKGGRVFPEVSISDSEWRIAWADGTKMRVDIDRDGAAAVDYSGGPTAFPHTYSLVNVLGWERAGRTDRLREAFNGRAVLVGLASLTRAPAEIVATPFSNLTPLLYLHANALDNLFRGRFLRRPPTALYLGLLLVIALATGALLSRPSLPISAVLAVGALLCTAATLQGALALGAVEIPTVMCLALPPLIYGVTGSFRVLVLEHRSRRREEDIAEGFVLQQQFLPEAMVGKRIANYRVDARIQGGGMGVVYRATDLRDGTAVALKLPPSGQPSKGELRRRFRHEARALQRLRHPNIARLIEFGTEHGIDYIAMELVEGASIQARLQRGPLQQREALEIALQTCRALCEAHAKGILHRDLKPANVMIARDGVVKLIDFGIAGFGEVGPTATTFTGPLTGTEEAVGTPAYMAPEVLLGTKADARADVYGMGMLLFEMLLGEYPFVSIPQMNLMQAIAYQPPPGLRLRNPRISDAAESLVLRCLSKDPAKRPDSALALQSALVGMLRS